MTEGDSEEEIEEMFVFLVNVAQILVTLAFITSH
jgi:hypothetical protein